MGVQILSHGRRLWARSSTRLRATLICAALVLLISTARFPVGEQHGVHGFSAPPSRLAHLLADYSAHPQGSWHIEEEGGNYTWWWYRVRYDCGARCGGSATVHAASGAPDAAPAHGDMGLHRVILSQSQCYNLPLLPWPKFCDDLEIEWIIEGTADKYSEVKERAVAWCSAVYVATGDCSRALASYTTAHLRAVRQHL